MRKLLLLPIALIFISSLISADMRATLQSSPSYISGEERQNFSFSLDKVNNGVGAIRMTVRTEPKSEISGVYFPKKPMISKINYSMGSKEVTVSAIGLNISSGTVTRIEVNPQKAGRIKPVIASTRSDFAIGNKEGRSYNITGFEDIKRLRPAQIREGLENDSERKLHSNKTDPDSKGSPGLEMLNSIISFITSLI